MLQEQMEELGPETRVALGLSFWKRGRPEQALEVVDPFFQQGGADDYSEMALHLALSIYLENGAWQRIVDLSDRVRLWELSDRSDLELDYSRALALENLDRPEESHELWTELAENKDLDLSQRGYTFYFLARDAKQTRALKDAYDYATRSLDVFLQTGEDPSKERELLGMLMEITANSGRVTESLQWAERYSKRVEPGDPDYPQVRYRMAQLYKKAGDTATWREILKELRDRAPGSLYGRMAASELQTNELEQKASQFQTSGRY
jgi:hypothetical protein